MTAYSEEVVPVTFSQGMYTADLASAIPDGYCTECTNAIPTGTSVESRFGFKSSSVGFNETYNVEQLPTGFTHFGFSGNADSPIIIWGSEMGTGTPKLNMIREGDPLTDPGGSGVITGVTIPSDFYSAVNYNGTYYLFLEGGVYKLQSINWTAGTFSTALVNGSPTGTDIQAVHFFNRLWTAKGSTLYWTDAISSPGGLPDTWNTSTNFRVFVGKNGPAKIFKIIPLGSRIFVFTSQGLFALTVSGVPSDWYSRPLDDNAIVNSYECAFEVGGLIYFISIYGVFVTNGSDSIKLSGPIENFFLAGNFEQGETSPSKRANVYRLTYMDGGMIASVSNYFIESNTAYYDVDYCHAFYSRLANTSWSQWRFNTTDETQLVGVQAIADSVETYINKSPVSYVMTIQTDSRDSGTTRSSVRELMVYDGLRDEWTNPVGSAGVSTANVRVDIKTQYFTSGSPNNFKTLKYAFLQLYLSDKTKYNDNNYWTYAWDTDKNNYDEGSSVLKIDPTDVWPMEFTSVKLATDFKFRLCQFQLTLNTQNLVNFKVKELYLVQHTERDGPNAIQ